MKYKHRKFIQHNGIHSQGLNDNLQILINGFNDLLKDSQQMIGAEKKALLERLEKLDLEIEEELIEDFADLLDPPPAKLTGNEALIDELYTQGIRRIPKQDLLNKGFQGSLTEKSLIVGKYKLQRVMFFLTYTITLNGS